MTPIFKLYTVICVPNLTLPDRGDWYYSQRFSMKIYISAYINRFLSLRKKATE